MAHRLLYHSTLGFRVIKKKKKTRRHRWCEAGRGGSDPLRLIDSCITQIKAQGPCRTCNESK